MASQIFAVGSDRSRVKSASACRLRHAHLLLAADYWRPGAAAYYWPPIAGR